MADWKPSVLSPSTEMPTPPTSPQQPPGDSGWALAFKALFWFIALPTGLIMLLKWLLAQ